MSIITVENLSKKFSGEYILKGVSFSLEKGESFYIVGENGSGKTTLIKLLLGLLDASSGNIKFEAVRKNQIGYMPQQNEIQSDFPANVNEIIMSGFLNKQGFSLTYSKSQKKKTK